MLQPGGINANGVKMKEITELIKKYLPEVTAFRHELHKIPEIAGNEVKTAAYIRKKISGLPELELKPSILGSDVTAMLGDETLPNITLRADIDALPITEKNDLPYRSTHAGMMHACGHDGHAAMLYGAMLCLRELQENLPCSVRFFFQPGEEVVATARQLVAAGALENPPAAFVAGIHNWPGVPYGKISTRCGAVMAAAGFFTMQLTGIGGHGSMPQKARNPLDTAAKLVAAGKKIIPPGCVLTFCAINGGSNTNVIPETCELQGTLRFLEPADGERLVADFKKLCSDICAADNVQWDLDLKVPYPPTINRQYGYETAKSVAVRYLGNDGFVEMAASSMSSEDFAYYLQKYDGVFCHLGTGENVPPLHTENYDFDDSILEYGIRFFVGTVLDFAAK